MPSARIAVVVSTYERPNQLLRLLEALRRQTVPAGEWELVVVDNGSSSETAAVLRDARARGDLPLVTLRHVQTKGPAGGRNAGWRATSAPLVAFTDDDCAPAPWWLAELLAAAGRAPGAIVQGRTRPYPAGGRATSLLHRSVTVDRLGPQFETCNILYPRALLEQVGGFDERYGLRPAGEDTDLALRALATGAGAVFAPEALVEHEVVRLTPRQALSEGTRWAGTARLFKRHPAARVMLHRRLFWDPWHYLLVRSLLACLLPGPLRPVRRTLHRRHLRGLIRRAGAAGSGPWAVPYLLVADAVGVAAMARAAVRERTPVL